jgi:hypothetical protein
VTSANPRVSASPIWTAGREYYEAQGAQAWGGARGVPTLVCNNAAIAGSYAALVRSFVQDCGAGDGSPAHVIEIGAGSGAFAHLFLTAEQELAARLGPPARPIKYVLTDAVPANLAFWGEQPRLRAHREAGRLDRACLDVLGEPTPLALVDGGAVLSRARHAGPVVVIANYVMDSLPCDVFRTSRGRLLEASLTLTPSLSPIGANDAVPCTYTFAPVQGAPYGDDALDRICMAYALRFRETTFTFPIGGIRCLRRLAHLTSGPLLVILTDKGYVNEQELAPITAPSLIGHTHAYSMSVNFDALGKYVTGDGGVALHTTGRIVDLQIAALAMRPPASLARTRTTFALEIDRKGPIEAFQVVLQAIGPGLTIAIAISILQLAGCDATVAARLGPYLRPIMASATPPERRVLGDLLERAAALTFLQPADADTALEIGGSLAALDRPIAALSALAESMVVFGPSPPACFGSGMCMMMLDHPAEALAFFDQALAIDPAYPAALHWRPQAVERLKSR